MSLPGDRNVPGPLCMLPTGSSPCAGGKRKEITDTMSTPKTDQSRKALHAYLSDEAHNVWHDRAAAYGVSVSAMLEAIALSIDEIDSEEDWGTGAEIVSRARSIDTDRRRRSRRT